MKSAENITLSLLSLIAIALMTSCSATKYLQPGETFVEANTVTIKSKEKVKNKKALQSELEQTYLQPETETWFGIPRHTFYYEAQKKPYDTTGINRWLMNRGDPPVILDSSLIEGTVDNMVLQLHQRGYWNGKVEYKVSTEGNRSRVNYLVDPMKRWTVRSIRYTTKDTVVQYILDTLLQDSHLAPGKPVDVDLFEQEKARVTLALQNLGYANFFQNYILEPVVDSSNYQMDLEIEVNTPPGSDHHIRYTIGSVSAYPEAPTDTLYRDTTINGVTFYLTDAWPKVRPEIIARNVYLKPGDLYSRNAYEKTQRQLGRLEIYRFISLKASVDLRDSALLHYNLTLQRNKLMQIGGDIELNYSTLASVSRTLVGLSGKVNLRHRNFLTGAELFSTNIESGVEVNLDKAVPSRFNSVNFNVQNNLLIPRFIDVIGFYRFMNELWPGRNGFLGDRTYRWLTEGNTNVGLGYQFLSLFNLYSYHSFTASLGYDAQPDLQRRLQLNHAAIDVFLPTKIDTAFKKILDANRFLRESFRKQLFTGFLFRDYRFSQTGRPRPRGINVSIIHSAEVSGLEIFGVNTLYNAITNRTGGFEIGKDTLSFSQFAKFEVDTRIRHVISPAQELAFRFATGVAFPYGPFTSQVPYIKQFYVGGPSSIRAWQIRELGPGGYQDPFNNPDGDLPFYQTGDIKIEMSAEYRFDIAWIFEGALFLDAGNIWIVQDDITRPGAVFSNNFLKQMAVGTGFGLRMDFTYFRIRLDFGYKLRNPYPIEGKYWLFDNFKEFSFRQFTTNFAIGYPF